MGEFGLGLPHRVNSLLLMNATFVKLVLHAVKLTLITTSCAAVTSPKVTGFLSELMMVPSAVSNGLVSTTTPTLTAASTPLSPNTAPKLLDLVQSHHLTLPKILPSPLISSTSLTSLMTRPKSVSLNSTAPTPGSSTFLLTILPLSWTYNLPTLMPVVLILVVLSKASLTTSQMVISHGGQTPLHGLSL